MEENYIDQKKSLNSSECYCINIGKLAIQDLKTAKDSRSPSLEENENLNNLISRKTQRGRKEKNSIPKNKLKCGVCLEFSDFSSEDLVSCSTCKCLFHYSCYNQSELTILGENFSYKCVRCIYALKKGKSINEFHCFICGYSSGVLNKNSITNDFYHQYCLNLLIELKGIEDEDICKENIRKWRYKNSCRFCGEKLCKTKAVIKCKNPKCKQFFHIPCAIEKGMIFDLKFMKKYYRVDNFSDIPFYCSNHNKKISFLYKDYVLNRTKIQNDEKNCISDIINNKEVKTFFNKRNNNIKKPRKRRIYNKSNRGKKNKRKFIIITNCNSNSNNKLNIDNNPPINNIKETKPVEKIEANINKMNTNNPFENDDDSNNNNGNIVDFEQIIKDSNINRNIFPEDFDSNLPLFKSNIDDSFNKLSETNSIKFFH